MPSEFAFVRGACPSLACASPGLGRRPTDSAVSQQRQQRQAQVADCSQESVKRRLVGYRAAQVSLAGGARREREAIEPIRPTLVQLALHRDAVDGGLAAARRFGIRCLPIIRSHASVP